MMYVNEFARLEASSYLAMATPLPREARDGLPYVI